jgi:F0F1-type ATP synthase assembly protein I
VKKEDSTFFYYLTLVTELGLVMAACILIGLGIGLYLDSKLNTKPFGILIFLSIGVLAAFANAYVMIMKKLK